MIVRSVATVLLPLVPCALFAGNAPPTIAVTSPVPLTGAAGDPTNFPVTVVVGDVETTGAALAVTAASSNPTVVPSANITVTSDGAAGRTVRLAPVGVGYATITLTVTDGGGASTATAFGYAASVGGGPAVRFRSGAAEASAAIAVDADFLFVGDDEDQALRLYRRGFSGPALAAFDFTSQLNLPDISGGVPREVDLEAAARVGNRVFWLGSQSNSPSGNPRPNRNRVFATDLTPAGAASTLTYVGRYDFLKDDLIAWDVAGAHGLGSNHYGLAASAAAGVPRELVNGYNLEALTLAPGSTTTAYLGFRAPIVPPAPVRTNALVVPVTNFTTLAAGGGPAGSAAFGAPIELDLGGRGIRSLDSNGTEIVILAGPAGSSTGVPPANFALYSWSGVPGDAPLERSTVMDIGGWTPEGIAEVGPGPLTSATPLTIVSDDGDVAWYGDGIPAGDHPTVLFRKFRSDVVTLGTIVPVSLLGFGVE